MYQRDLLPSFAGVFSFIRAPLDKIQELQPGVVAVAGVPHDSTSSARQGVRDAPKAIREASVDFIYDLQSSPTQALVNVDTGQTIKLPATGRLVDLGDLRIYPLEIARTCTSLQKTMCEIVQRGAFPVMLGGDHYITYPLLQGFKEGVSARGGKKIGYIQLSSQLDLAEQDEIWGKDWHGATVKRILDSRVVDPQNIAWIGLHGYIPADEWKLAHNLGATVITSYTLRERGIVETVQQVESSVCQGCDSIYLSLDIGVVDGGQIPGRGDITVGSLTPVELLGLVRALSRLNIGALDVVEVAPTWDPLARTQRLAAEAIVEFIAPKVFFG